jgi:hypothetical protein
MQFMPATWRLYGVDGDGDGVADIDDVSDAVFSATHLLCIDGAGNPKQLPDAIWDYNHSDSYVAQVLDLAASYGSVANQPGGVSADPSELVTNPRVILSENARRDLEAGIVDPRLVVLLELISRRFTIGISVIKTGHSKYVEGTNRVSDHYFGRAADISVVEGRPVGVDNRAARLLVVDLSRIAGALCPDEVGSPFASLHFPGAFSDADHSNHIHIGFDS